MDRKSLTSVVPVYDVVSYCLGESSEISCVLIKGTVLFCFVLFHFILFYFLRMATYLPSQPSARIKIVHCCHMKYLVLNSGDKLVCYRVCILERVCIASGRIMFTGRV